MLAKDIIAAIQDGTCDFELDNIRRAVAIREVVWKRETDADAMSERRGAMREAMMERRFERPMTDGRTREICDNGAIGRTAFQPGDIVRIKQTSNLSPRYLVGRELVFLKARVSNGEVRYLVPDRTKYGSVAKFACPMRELEFVRKG